MLDPQVSFIRLLVGDNDRTAPFYSDAQIRAVATISPTRPAFPSDLRMSGLVGVIRYPIPQGGLGGVLSLATLTDAQLAALSDEQLASMVD